MNTLLDAIKLYPAQFINTLKARAMTTPCEVNKSNHLLLALNIKTGHWERVEHILTLPEYRKPLDGVVYCLKRYSDIEGEVWYNIADLLKQGKLS